LLQARQIRASIADNIITRVFAASTASTPASEVPPSLDDPGLPSRSGAATPAGDEVPIVYVSASFPLRMSLISGRKCKRPRERVCADVTPLPG
jgi:hypothetical protein